jgi:hypothetical protein
MEEGRKNEKAMNKEERNPLKNVFNVNKNFILLSGVL